MYDISYLLKHWEYDPNKVTVRLIEGFDKKPKIQMRLDLGILQMNYDGRPDGERPYGFDSLLEYYQHQLDIIYNDSDKDEQFTLNGNDCEALRNEALQYYYRYLSLFHLQEYEAVERDTARNLAVFDLIREYAEEDDDRYALEQYRPYVLMMNARAAAHRLLEMNRFEEAITRIKSAIKRINQFFSELGRADLAKKCSEILLLKKFAEEIEETWKTDPIGQLRQKMYEAVEREDYETAAKIRDEIKKIS